MRLEPSARSALLARIEQVLDDQVRPELRSESGVELVLVGIDEDRIVQVRLSGACGSCSTSVLYALTMQVESALKAAVPEVRFVEAVP
jgi:Fe-S cluster biogenesis protein NfuA